MKRLIPTFLTLAVAGTVQAQGMEMPMSMPMDHSHMDHAGMPAPTPAAPADASAAQAANRILPRGEQPVPPQLDMPGMHRHGEGTRAKLLFDKFEYQNGRDDNGLAWDMDAWWGGDFDKLWLQSEGEHRDGKGEGRLEALWSHALDAFWDSRLGVRHDYGEGPDRQWLAFGVSGATPWWFETEAMLYLGDDGRSALRLDVERELLLTQKLVLVPELEASAYGKDDPGRGIGSGLSDASFGLRLRYEVSRQFAPYVGVEWSRRFGDTADMAREEGGSRSDRQLVAGVRFWF